MKAFVLDSFDEPPAVRNDLPQPVPGDNELLVRVRASSVNPVDVHIAAGALKAMADYEFPVTIGRDFAGVVEQVGSAVSRYQAGEQVFGFLPHVNPSVHDGSWAKLISVPEDKFVATAPQSVDAAAARRCPARGHHRARHSRRVAARRRRHGASRRREWGRRQLLRATRRSSRRDRIAAALPEDQVYLRGLGVAELIDRNAELATTVSATHPEGVDAMLDLATFAPDASPLKDGGCLASPLGAAGEGPGRFNVMAQSTPENLKRLAELIDDGTLGVPASRAFDSIAQPRRCRHSRPQHIQGKLGLAIA